jgi:hypothetical protein
VPESSVEELAQTARTAIRALAEGGDPASFQELLALSEEVGVGLGVAARAIAESGSWSQVATYAGTTKQAAWARWRGE